MMSINQNFRPTLDEQNAVNAAALQSVRPYNSNQEYLYAMREDLADWLKGLYAIDIDVSNFIDMLKTGTILCQHANNITNCAEYMRKSNGNLNWKYINKVPSKYLKFTQIKNAGTSTFFSRDNVATFINWCRNELGIHESLMFETNDLVQKKSEKNFILCLLEVARRGSRLGVPAPVLIQMEEDIDEEIELEKVSKEKNLPPPKKPVKQKVTCDFKSLDEMVQYILGMCTCPSQFPMVRVSDGKYKVGGSESLIFMRILRQHVMVRVGGGWDTLEQYLNKHDPCRCQVHKNDRNTATRHSRSANPSRPNLAPDRSSMVGQTGSKSTLDVRRSQQIDRRSRSPNVASDRLRHTTAVDKRMNQLTAPARPRSHTPTGTTRQSRSKFASPAADEKRGRDSVIKKTPQTDFFNRLSRPKSTPPVTRNTTAFQDDLVVVKRSEEGSHQLQRSSVAKQSQIRHSVNDRTRGKSREKLSDPRSKSVAAPAVRSSVNKPSRDTVDARPRDSTSGKNWKHRRSASSDNDKNRTPVSMSPRKTRPVIQPLHEEIDAERERAMLEAFERECIANQNTLQMRQSRARRSSADNLLEAQANWSNGEDSEVAFHMQASNDSLQIPNTYHSLPRPRKHKHTPAKDKSSQHERRTRIPTPVSFNNRSLLNPRNIDLNDSVDEKEAGTSKPDSPKTPQKKETPDDVITQTRPLAEDRVVNYHELLGGSEIERKPQRNAADRSSKDLDAALLHSSAHSDPPAEYTPPTRSAPPAEYTPPARSVPPAEYTPPARSAFVPFENRTGVDASGNLQTHTGHDSYPPFQPYEPNQTPHSHPSVSDHHVPFNSTNPVGFSNGQSLSHLPEHKLNRYGVTSAPRLPSFVQSPTSHTDSFFDSREPQWV